MTKTFNLIMLSLTLCVGVVVFHTNSAGPGLADIENSINLMKDTKAKCYEAGADYVCEIQRKGNGDPVYHFENLMFIKNKLADIEAGMKQNGFKGSIIVKEIRRARSVQN